MQVKESETMSEERFDFIETDAQFISDLILDTVMDEVDEPLYPGDERRIYTNAIILVAVMFFNKLNDASKQKMLRYARGYVLDALGERTNTERLQPSKANAIFRFSVAATQNGNIVIPAGTRITPDGEIYFATQNATVLQSGESYVDVEGVCTTGGSEYNGLKAGTVNVLVDLIPFISVENINDTNGGDDGEPYPWEDDGTGDERYRERIRLSASRASVGGTVTSYKYMTLSSDPNIIAVEIDSPKGNYVDIYVLMEGGRVPNAAEIADIQKTFAMDDSKIMCDIVTVKAPTVQQYDIELVYYCTVDNEAQAVQTVEADGGAIDQYNEWQQGAMGRDINPDELQAFIKRPSDGTRTVERVEIVKPVYATLDAKKVAKFSGNLKISHNITTL